ncbi:TnsA endonuclease N-terminal domain-containing protein [Clostridium sp. SHJSY1]|uniref:TnsA endonuclease N-terminal domain-containing protein n=1 Tax=Clostridium sp. SHJSY1 TaxID=2942483 RepID=UPI002875789E|nr:TnsA endonuclease N-terminal domain-containing protein [Clostridium sp. SHJSY1]MDS0527607.1 TnsA endonuclease N-terminal domain-containing protein [Clostridium sp. SHJSY1]
MDKKEEYVSGIKIQDFPSRGRVSRVKGKTTGRLHHLLSDLESNVFYLLDFQTQVIDIKEHYPLLDLFDLDINLENINLNKFKNKKTGEQYLFTTTFVITVNDEGIEKYIAISVKNESQLYKTTTQEKLEVERRYWKAKGVDWFIITNKDIEIERVENIKWLLLGDNEIDYDKEILIENLIVDSVQTSSSVSIISLIANIEKLLELNGEVVAVLKKMIVANKIKTDLNKKITLNDKISRFVIGNEERGYIDEYISN